MIAITKTVSKIKISKEIENPKLIKEFG